MLFVVGGIFVVVASDTTQTYNVAIVGYLACGLVLTTSSVNALVYSTNGAREAAAAGFILLSMVTVSSDDGFCFCRAATDCTPTDRLDLLLRLCPVGRSARLPRFIRPV